MHWDVVEVKPEPRYCLFVRFKDGVAGRIQLRPEELTGALAPAKCSSITAPLRGPAKSIWPPMLCMLKLRVSAMAGKTLADGTPACGD